MAILVICSYTDTLTWLRKKKKDEFIDVIQHQAIDNLQKMLF